MSAQPMHDEPQLSIRSLTAQVTTIMMNNRQVTLSVARQLDRVDFFTMEPWGRVSLPASGKTADWTTPLDIDGVVVIGACKGTLVTAEVPPASTVRNRELRVTSGHVYACLSSAVASQLEPTFRVDGVTLAIQRERVISHYNINGRHCEGRCVPTFSDDIALGMSLKIAAHKMEQRRDTDRIFDALALDKIVLAGLK